MRVRVWSVFWVLQRRSTHNTLPNSLGQVKLTVGQVQIPWKLLGFTGSRIDFGLILLISDISKIRSKSILDPVKPKSLIIKQDSTQEFHRSYWSFISQCTRTNKFRCVWSGFGQFPVSSLQAFQNNACRANIRAVSWLDWICLTTTHVFQDILAVV